MASADLLCIFPRRRAMKVGVLRRDGPTGGKAAHFSDLSPRLATWASERRNGLQYYINVDMSNLQACNSTAIN